VVGDGSSQLSAYESTSSSMTLSLSADGHYAWERDVIHDSGYWEVQGGYITFEQDSGGQYAWPYRLSGSGSRQVLTLVTEQGGTTKLHRIR
jgi:predicted secreted protein